MASDVAEIAKAIAEINDKIDKLSDALGKESDDGKSGTGLVGEVRRQGQDLKSLVSLRDSGRGALWVITIILGIVSFFLRQQLVTLIFGPHK